MHMQQLLTTKQAAQFLGVSEAFLERARWAGKPAIPYLQVSSRCVRYSPDALEQYLRARVKTSTSDPGSPPPGDKAP